MKQTVLQTLNGEMDVARELANQVYPMLAKFPILLLKGDLGSGKTTFCKLLLQKAGLSDEVTSPTFNLVSEYMLADGDKVFHFDLYRVKHEDELIEFGFYEYIDSGYPCIVEWPEIVESQLKEPHLVLEIQHQENGRSYTLSLYQ